ncbi:hypothetical protein GCM10022261_11830 [Brevibacterium daeguense]|uniref:Uncharacterized protein n=1 Tax=Brevibacterium daeguense TaxID=909936 RepID=A0ABP8EI84_9MICO|nr:hypothetical protein [Brevibacterium daeguense]
MADERSTADHPDEPDESTPGLAALIEQKNRQRSLVPIGLAGAAAAAVIGFVILGGT